MFQTQAVGNAYLDLAGGFLVANEKLCQITGIDREHLIQCHIWDIIDPADTVRARELFLLLLSSDQPEVTLEAKLLRRNRDLVWVSITFTRVSDEDGQPLWISTIVKDLTVRKTAEAAQAALIRELEGEREKLQEILSAAPAFICTLEGPDHVFRFANRAYFDLIGQRQIIGCGVRQALPDLEHQPFFALLDQVFASGQRFSANAMPITLARRAGGSSEQRFVNFVYLPLRDSQDNVTGILVHGVDVTEQKLAEQALRRSEEKLRNVLESSADCIKLLDCDARLLWMNGPGQRAIELKDFSNLKGQNWIDFWKDADRVAAERAVAAAQRGEIGTFEGFLPTASGMPKWWSMTVSPVLDATGKPEQLLAISRDITERRLAERALRESEQRFRTLVANLPGAVYRCRLDAAWSMIYVSDGVEQITGYGAQSFLSGQRSFAQLIDSGDDLHNRECVDRAIRDGTSFSLEYRIRHADGNIRWIYETGQAQLGPDGELLWLDGVMFDITERRQATEQLHFQEVLLRSQTECSIDGILAVRLDGQIILSNRRFQEIWGVADDLIAAGDDNAVLASVRDKLAEPDGFFTRVRELMSEPNLPSRDEILLKDGRILDRYSSPLAGEDGIIHGRVWYFRDVTNERRATQALRENEELLRRMFEAGPDCIKTLDLDGRLLTMNSCGMRLMHVDNFKDVEGSNWVEFWQGSQRAQANEAIRTARAGGVGVFEGPCATLRGERKWWHVAITSIPDASGRPQRLLAISRDLTDRHALEDRLLYASTHDALTGLPNRSMFFENVGRCLARSKQEPGYAFGVLFLDLDRFKLINDSLGHAAGDRLLMVVADRLRECVSRAECVSDELRENAIARLGGDEFTVLLDQVARPEDAGHLANQILAAVAEPFEFEGQEIITAASIGIVAGGQGSRASHDSAKDFLRDADTAMYRAKSTGRNRVAVFDSTMHDRAVERLRIENGLRKALERSELFLQYQPIVSLRTRELEGFEALVRWRHEGQSISPGMFIPVAEDSGLIVPIGAWVFETACAQLAQWRAQFPSLPISMAVNVSRRQFADADLLPLIQRTLTKTNLPPASIKMEVTESVIMDDDEAGRKVLSAIKRTGVQISMDDFGTGYSSLAFLHKFPIDVLKIDRSFVHNLEARRDASAVVSAIVQLAHNLKMSVVAEGLETAEQLAFLQAVECDFGQGYLFSKPVFAQDAAELIARSQLRIQPLAA